MTDDNVIKEDKEDTATKAAIDNVTTDNVTTKSPVERPVESPIAISPMLRQHKAWQTSLPKSNNSFTCIHHNNQAILPVEAAIAIVINGIHYAVLMASPNQLDYLALGFLYSEGLITNRKELLDWDVRQVNKQQLNSDSDVDKQLVAQLLDYDVYMVELTLNQRSHQRIKAQRRQLAGRTGCGICGITGLTQALPNLDEFKRQIAPKPQLQDLLDIKNRMDSDQKAHQLTGAVHAAATLYNGDLILFEDVGRHNALDKLIGWQLRYEANIDYVVMTSRLSIELVQKCIRLRLPWLIGMSAPTSTAVKVAERYGLGLAGFLRDNRVTYYTGY